MWSQENDLISLSPKRVILSDRYDYNTYLKTAVRIK